MLGSRWLSSTHAEKLLVAPRAATGGLCCLEEGEKQGPPTPMVLVQPTGRGRWGPWELVTHFQPKPPRCETVREG